MSKLLTLYHKYGVLIKIIIFRPWRYTTVAVINEIDLILLLTQAFAVRNTWKFLSKERTGWFASRVRNFWSACCLTLRNSGLNLSSLRRLCFSGRGWKLKVYCIKCINYPHFVQYQQCNPYMSVNIIHLLTGTRCVGYDSSSFCLSQRKSLYLRRTWNWLSSNSLLVVWVGKT